MFLRLILATIVVFHEVSIHDRCVCTASLCRLPVQMQTFYRSRTQSFKANRLTSTRRGFKWAPVSVATPCTVVNPILDARVRRSARPLFVQGDESFLMESLSIHLLSYHHNHRQLTAPLKYPRLTGCYSIATDLRDRSRVKDLKSIVSLINLIATMHCRIRIYVLIVKKSCNKFYKFYSFSCIKFILFSKCDLCMIF